MMNQFRAKLKSKKGFTLIELIVVIAIIAILIALLVPNVAKFVKSAKDTSDKANAKTIYTAAQTYCTQRYTDDNEVKNWGAEEIKGTKALLSDPTLMDKATTKVNFDEKTKMITSVTFNDATYPSSSTSSSSSSNP